MLGRFAVRAGTERQLAAQVGREHGEVCVGDWAKALFCEEGLVAQFGRTRVVTLHRGLRGSEHERDRGGGMVGGAREGEDQFGVEPHYVVDLQNGDGQVADEPHSVLEVSGSERDRHRREQVVVVAGEAGAPLDLCWPKAVTLHHTVKSLYQSQWRVCNVSVSSCSTRRSSPYLRIVSNNQ